MNILLIARIGAYLIALVAGAQSYGHQHELLAAASLGTLYAWAVPATVDLLAFLAAMVRNSDVADAGARRAALWTLLLAGSASVAANVAVGENVVQRLVGVWTVAAYLLAEFFVSKLKAKPAPAPVVEPVVKVVDPIRSDAARRGAETKRRNRADAEKARRAAARASRTPKAPADTAEAARMLAAAGDAPVSPAPGLGWPAQ
jgi:hypothetical protein